MTSATPLNVGIVGLGRLGRRHAECLAHHVPGARLVAACNPSAGALDWARDQLGVTPLHQDFNHFITTAAGGRASPPTEHAPQFEAALRAGKHVFVEKPLSLDVATCEALAALAAAHPAQVVMV